jgi:uncharacterized membrane protein
VITAAITNSGVWITLTFLVLAVIALVTAGYMEERAGRGR